jgi:hypothetical protein
MKTRDNLIVCGHGDAEKTGRACEHLLKKGNLKYYNSSDHFQLFTGRAIDFVLLCAGMAGGRGWRASRRRRGKDAAQELGCGKGMMSRRKTFFLMVRNRKDCLVRLSIRGLLPALQFRARAAAFTNKPLYGEIRRKNAVPFAGLMRREIWFVAVEPETFTQFVPSPA